MISLIARALRGVKRFGLWNGDASIFFPLCFFSNEIDFIKGVVFQLKDSFVRSSLFSSEALVPSLNWDRFT